MGWLYTAKPSYLTTAEFLKKESMEWDNEKSKCEVLAMSVKFTVAYAAVRITYKQPRETKPDDFVKPLSFVTAFVYLIRHVPKAKDGYTFGYKDMDETVGPCEIDCPLHILNMLTPEDELYGEGKGEYARKWRASVREYWERRQRSKLKDGDKIKLSYPLTFGNNAFKEDTFIFRKGSTFLAVSAGMLCRITKWRDREFTKL